MFAFSCGYPATVRCRGAAFQVSSAPQQPPVAQPRTLSHFFFFFLFFFFFSFFFFPPPYPATVRCRGAASSVSSASQQPPVASKVLYFTLFSSYPATVSCQLGGYNHLAPQRLPGSCFHSLSYPATASYQLKVPFSGLPSNRTLPGSFFSGLSSPSNRQLPATYIFHFSYPATVSCRVARCSPTNKVAR